MPHKFLTLLLSLSCISCSAQNTYNYETPPAFERPVYDSGKDKSLYPIWQNGKQGYMDVTGKVVVTPSLDWTTDFYYGAGVVRFQPEGGGSGDLGLVDSKGKIIWRDHDDMEVEVASSFQYGLHMIRAYRDGEHLYGYINRKGELAIPLFFNKAHNFKNGFAAVCVHDPRMTKDDHFRSGSKEEKSRQRWGFINTQGALVVPFTYNDVEDFSEGLAPVCMGTRDEQGNYLDQRGKWGYIDTTGKLVIEMKYIRAGNFHDGLAYVEMEDKKGFIDTQGNLVISLKFDRVDSFFEGLALASIDGKDFQELYGFIDKNGDWVIPPIYHYATDFENGMACVKTDSGKYGMINRKGAWVIQPKFDGLIFISEGIGVTELNGMHGVIDSKGNPITPFMFSDAGVCNGGLAYVVTHGNFYHPDATTELGYVNRKGEFVWKLQR